jgi:hypothetical protein
MTRLGNAIDGIRSLKALPHVFGYLIGLIIFADLGFLQRALYSLAPALVLPIVGGLAHLVVSHLVSWYTGKPVPPEFSEYGTFAMTTAIVLVGTVMVYDGFRERGRLSSIAGCVSDESYAPEVWDSRAAANLVRWCADNSESGDPDEESYLDHPLGR